MTKLPATCPLTGPVGTYGNVGGYIDTAPEGLGDRRWNAQVCPLTGLHMDPAQATTGQIGGIPMVHDRYQCPQPCMTHWWRDSSDNALSWQGSEIRVDYPDLVDEPAEPVEPFLWPSQHHGGDRPGEQSLMDFAKERHAAEGTEPHAG